MTDRPEDLWLIGLAADVCEGRPVDWRRAESQVASPEVDAILRGLKRLAGVVDAHRSIAEPAAPSDASVQDHPKVWRHLAVLEVAGIGAFGTVYRAWDAQLEREVALKLLTVSGNRLPLTEAQHLARVRHPNIVTVYGAEQTEQQVGIWMEFIEGETLADSVGQRGSMSAREVAGIGIDLCRALSALHAAGLVHRDVKAQNVMREVGGRIVLMDFSGSGALDPGESGPELSGTPLYMAPELLEGFPASPVTDTYSVGVLLFYLLSGYLPVAGSSLADVRRAHIEGKRIRPSGSATGSAGHRGGDRRTGGASGFRIALFHCRRSGTRARRRARRSAADSTARGTCSRRSTGGVELARGRLGARSS